MRVPLYKVFLITLCFEGWVFVKIFLMNFPIKDFFLLVGNNLESTGISMEPVVMENGTEDHYGVEACKEGPLLFSLSVVTPAMSNRNGVLLKLRMIVLMWN